jgi:hypothetical protein
VKKLTVKEFAAKLRETYPGQLDNIDDITLTYRWTKKYPKSIKYLDKTDALSNGFTFTKDNVVSWFKKQNEKLASDSTVQKTKDKLTDLVDKTKLNVTPSPEQKDVEPPQEKTVTTKYVTQYPNETKPNKAFKSRPCDENVFPWTYGCKNKKIGQMNDIYFGDTYGDIYGNNLYTKLESLGSFKAPGEKDGQISEKIYNMTLQDSLQENQKIVVKETVKKVLKERLNNN